jgi:anti-anti-sigma factor
VKTTVEIQERQLQQPVTVLMPEGRLDLVSAPVLKARLQLVIARGTRQIVVDLSGVSLVDSTGLATLLHGMRRLRTMGGDLRIARPNRQMLLVLDSTHLEHVLPPYAAVDDAVADIGTA